MTNNSQQRIMNNENLLLIIIEVAYIIVYTLCRRCEMNQWSKSID